MNTNPPQPRSDRIGVLALVPDRWSSNWQTRHHLISRLAKYFDILWVAYPPWWREYPGLLWRGESGASDYPTPVGMQVYHPEFWLPRVGRPPFLARFVAKERLKRAYRLLRARGCTKVVLYMWRPEFGDAIHQVPHDLSIYHIDDEYSFSSTETEIPAEERQLLTAAEQVFIHSPAMMKKKGSFNRNTQLLPNGVDYSLYATKVTEPEDLRGIPHPRIGYVGYLKKMLNWPLLLELTAAHPDWSFVFVGERKGSHNIEELLDQMAQRPNVHFLGGKPTEGLGAYPQHLDVCIMPYHLDDYTKYIYPLKLHEYLAGGRPVVSTPICSVIAFSDVLATASSPEDWSKAIQNALSESENTPEKVAQRQKIAQQHDWDVLAERVAQVILARFPLHGIP